MNTYNAYGAVAALFRCTDPEVLIEGPAGTGKSRGALEKANWLAQAHPGVRGALLRKTRVSMTQSTLVTFEDKVLGPKHYMLRSGPRRANRQSYEYNNGSEIVVAGMDEPTRLFSAEYDFIFVEEAIEFTLDEWESLHRALRNGRGPYHQLFAATNPGPPAHWLNKRCGTDERPGRCTRLKSRFTDNPSITKEYLKRLARLTGPRRGRLYEGRWCSSEGMVWENFDELTHLITPPRRPDGFIDYEALGIRWFAGGIDWGHSSPGAAVIAGITATGRVYIVAEVYESKRGIPWWCRRFSELHSEFDVSVWWGDPSRPDMIALVNEYLGSTSNDPNHALVRPAYNTKKSTVGVTGTRDMSGLDIVRSALDPDPKDKQPNLLWFRDRMRHGPDSKLLEEGKPTSSTEEIPGYVMASPKSHPDRILEVTNPDCPDHGCDAVRYVVCGARGRDLFVPAAKKLAPGVPDYARDDIELLGLD